MISWEKLDEYKVDHEVKKCKHKNCGRPRIEHVRISFGGNIYNDWCPTDQQGNPWGSTRTIWREI